MTKRDWTPVGGPEHDDEVMDHVLSRINEKYQGRDFSLLGDLDISVNGALILLKETNPSDYGFAASGQIFRDLSRYLHRRVRDGSATISPFGTIAPSAIAPNRHADLDMVLSRTPSKPHLMGQLILSTMDRYMDCVPETATNVHRWTEVGQAELGFLQHGIAIVSLVDDPTAA